MEAIGESQKASGAQQLIKMSMKWSTNGGMSVSNGLVGVAGQS